MNKIYATIGVVSIFLLLLIIIINQQNKTSNFDSLTSEELKRKFVDENITTMQLGRLTTKQPEWLSWQGGRFSIGKVMINEESWSDDISPTEGFNQRWDSTISKLRERNFKGVADVEEIIIEERKIKPGLQSVLYHRGYSPEELMWHALLKTEPVGVTFQKNSWKNEEEKDLEGLVEVADAYQKDAGYTDNGVGFHLQHGKIALPVRDNESVAARYTGRSTEITYNFSVSAPVNSSPSQESGLLKKAAQAVNLNTDTIRDRRRTVANLPGHEEIVRYNEDEETVTFLWTYSGVKNMRSVKIEIEMETPAELFKERLYLWDWILESLLIR